MEISTWIEKQAKIAGATSLIVGISGGVDSAVTAGLCKNTSLSTIGVLMPCHSSPESITRAQEVVDHFKIESHHVNLEDSFESIRKQLPDPDNVNFCQGALRSCLRAPTLDYVAKLYNGIIVGTGNRDEDEVTRYFQKRGDGAVDICPISKLHKSQVYALASELGVPKSVIDAVPSADLWGGEYQSDEQELGMTYADIEWGIKQAEKFLPEGVTEVSSRELKLAACEGRKDILLKLASMEEKSRHKMNPNLPVFTPP
jgi:NAD+ synthase